MNATTQENHPLRNEPRSAGTTRIMGVDLGGRRIIKKKLQLFLDKYGNSEYAKEANELTLDLLTRLQKKEFEIAKQYDLIRDYQAAMKSLDNFLLNNPGSVFREEALYTRLHSAYEWAINSVEHKKEERLQVAKEAYETLMKAYPDTKFKKDANTMLAKVNSSLKSITQEK